MAVLEGLWNCSQCLRKGIPGLQACFCGHERNQTLYPEEALYLPPNAREITDPDELAYAASGPSWNCGTCGSLNRGDTTLCSKPDCGMPRGPDDMVNPVYTYVQGKDAEGVAVSDPKVKEDDWTDAVLQSADKLQELEEDPVAMPNRTFHLMALPRQGVHAVRDAARRSNTYVMERYEVSLKPILVGLVALFVLLVGGGVTYVNFFQTKDVTLEVTGLSWERKVEVEAFRTLTQEGWDYPGDARVLSSASKVHHYDRVLDHYEDRERKYDVSVPDGTHTESYPCGTKAVDNGNGTFSYDVTYCDRQVQDYRTETRTEKYKEPIYRDDPVYRTYYVYEIDRWVTDYFERAAGETRPYWPVPDDLSAKQRVGDERKQSYEVVLVDEAGRSFQRDVAFETWTLLEEGEEVPGKENRRGSLRSVQWPTS